MDNSNITSTQPPEPIAPVTPPGGNIEHRKPPVQPFTPGMQPGDMKLENVQVVEEIQSMHSGFAELNEYEQTNLKFSLANAGLPETGAILNTIA